MVLVGDNELVLSLLVSTVEYIESSLLKLEEFKMSDGELKMVDGEFNISDAELNKSVISILQLMISCSGELAMLEDGL